MKKYLCLVLLALFIIGCDSESVSITDQGVADPFLLGNYWVYERMDYDTDGILISTSEDSITVTTVSNNQFKLNESDFYYKDSTGIFYAGWLWYQYPASLGDTMFVTSDIMIKVADSTFSGHICGSVIGKGVQASTKAGVFTTYKYQYDFITQDQTVVYRSITYFSPSVGVIKEEHYEADAFQPPLALVRVKELLRYKIR